MKKFIYLLVFTLISVSGYSAEWSLNRDHSEIFFQVPYLGVSELTGRFNSFDAKVGLSEKFVPQNLEVKIKVSSIDTGNKMRDGHLKGAEFFESSAYPEILFKSQRIKPLGASRYEAEGVLTIKNVSRSEKIQFSLTKTVKDTWGYENFFVKFNSAINRHHYNIKWNKTLDNEKYLVGEKIDFRGTFQMQPLKHMTPPSKHMIPDTEYIRQREIKNREEESSFSSRFRKLIHGK